MVAWHLRPTNYDTIASAVLGDNTHQDLYTEPLASQIEDVHTRSVPDLYLFTAYSAVPLADAMRGYYDTTGSIRPRMGYIRADMTVSHGYSAAHNRRRQERLEAEKQRLSELQDADIHACVVDEYKLTGKTVGFAALILQQLNIRHISTIEGAWYEQADRTDISLRRLTSIHASFMYKLGQTAAERSA